MATAKKTSPIMAIKDFKDLVVRSIASLVVSLAAIGVSYLVYFSDKIWIIDTIPVDAPTA